MLVESIAILMILLVMIFIFLRGHRRIYAVSTVPLLVVPFVHALVYIFADISKLHFSQDILTAVDAFGLAVAVALLGMFCTRCKTRKAKYAYLFLCGGFTTILSIIFIFNNYVPV